MKLKHISGIEGEYVRTAYGPYGEMTVIKVTDGREFFAPSREFKE